MNMKNRMRIIQTFWSGGTDSLSHSYGWPHPEYNLMSWALSYCSLREHYEHKCSLMKIVFILAALMCSASVFSMTTVTVRKAGTLGSLLTQAQQDTCATLAIVGKLNSVDIKVLREMGKKKLELIDISQVQMVTSKEPYMVLDAAEESLVCAAYVDKAQYINYGIYNINKPRILKLGVVYVLNYQSEEKFSVAHTASFTYRTNQNILPDRKTETISDWKPRTLVSKDEFVFRKGLKDDQWKMLKRSGLTKFAGHRVQKENGKYILYSCTKKGIFSGDFFYKCPSVKVVVIPEKKSLDESITEYGNPVKYMHKEVVINNLK